MIENFDPHNKYDEEKVFQAIEGTKESPNIQHMFAGVGVAKLVVAQMSQEGQLIGLSNVYDLHRQKALLLVKDYRDCEEEFMAHLDAIKSGRSTLHMQISASSVEDIRTFKEKLLQNLDLLGGFGEAETELMDPSFENGEIAKYDETVEDGDTMPSFVMRLNIPVTLYEQSV